MAKVEGDQIILGSAISFTGKYSTNGVHTSNGYNLAVKKINESGGVNIVFFQQGILGWAQETWPERFGLTVETESAASDGSWKSPLHSSCSRTCCWSTNRRSASSRVI